MLGEASSGKASSGRVSPEGASRGPGTPGGGRKRPACPAYRPKPLGGAVAPVEHMRRRADFLAARRGERRGGPWFTLELLDRGLADAPPRLGLTVTKKVGNAVLRNRVRRRLREAVRTAVAGDMRAGHDYVIVARAEAASVPFGALVEALRERIARPAHSGPRGGGGRPKRTRRSGRATPRPPDESERGQGAPADRPRGA